MKIYAGETLNGTMVLKDESNQPITDLSSYEITMLLHNKYDEYSVQIDKSGMSIEGSKIQFQFTSEQTKQLKQIAVLELKVVKDSVVKIAKQDLFYVEDNKIKDL